MGWKFLWCRISIFMQLHFHKILRSKLHIKNYQTLNNYNQCFGKVLTKNVWLRNSFWFFAFYSPLTAIVKYLCCYKEKSVFHYIFFIPLCCWKATSVGHFMLAIFWQKPKCKHISVVYSVVIYIGYTPLSRIIISLLIEIWRRKQTLSKWFEWTWRDQRLSINAK